MNARRFADAAEVLESLGRLAPLEASTHFDLGTAWLRAGQPSRAIEPLNRVIALTPHDGRAHAHLGMALEEIGEIHAAIVTLREAARLMPESSVVAYHLGAIGGAASPEICPPDYLVSLFDDYASRFDDDLVNRLHYAGPELLARAVARHGAAAKSLEILDLGCGTGLCAKFLLPFAKRIVGVDLSPRMIDAARVRGMYDELLNCDVLDALRNRQSDYDLIVAADVFIYIGDLRKVFVEVAAALRPGGCFAFTIESIDGVEYALRATRRYAHSLDYINELAKQIGFKQASAERCVLRTPPSVDGYVILLRRGS